MIGSRRSKGPAPAPAATSIEAVHQPERERHAEARQQPPRHGHDPDAAAPLLGVLRLVFLGPVDLVKERGRRGDLQDGFGVGGEATGIAERLGRAQERGRAERAVPLEVPGSFVQLEDERERGLRAEQRGPERSRREHLVEMRVGIEVDESASVRARDDRGLLEERAHHVDGGLRDVARVTHVVEHACDAQPCPRELHLRAGASLGAQRGEALRRALPVLLGRPNREQALREERTHESIGELMDDVVAVRVARGDLKLRFDAKLLHESVLQLGQMLELVGIDQGRPTHELDPSRREALLVLAQDVVHGLALNRLAKKAVIGGERGVRCAGGALAEEAPASVDCRASRRDPPGFAESCVEISSERALRQWLEDVGQA